MYRWPLVLSRGGSAGSGDVFEACTIEVAPRAAAFTLFTLAGFGHPTHLSLVDAYLAGQVLMPDVFSFHRPGVDTAGVLARIAAPLLVAYERGADRITLAEIVPLPPTFSNDWIDHDFLALSGPKPLWVTIGIDMPSGLFPDGTRGILTVERPGWIEADVNLPPASAELVWMNGISDRRPSIDGRVVSAGPLPPRFLPGAEASPDVRELAGVAVPAVTAALRRLGLARAARSWRVHLEAMTSLEGVTHARRAGWTQQQRGLLDGLFTTAFGGLPWSVPTRGWSSPDDILERFRRLREDAVKLHLGTDAWVSYFRSEALRAAPTRIVPVGRIATTQLAPSLESTLSGSRFADGVVEYDGLSIDVALAPEADGGATLSLLPPVEPEPIPNLIERMEAAAREVLVGLMAMAFAESRREPIEHRLIGPEGTTTLLVGWSLVLPRNRRVFAAWLGSDGRVVIRLFPREGQPARGRL